MAPNPLIRRNPPKLPTNTLHKSAGMLDDYAVRKDVATLQGTIEHDPSNPSDLVNKNYVDSVAANPEIDLFFTQDASDIATYFNLDVDLNVTTETTNVTSAIANTTTLLAAFATQLNEEEIDSIEFLETGIYDMHIHIIGGSNNNLSVYFEIYHRTSGGTETLLGTSSDSNPLTTSDVEYNIHASVTTEKIWAVGDRIVIKVYGRNTGTPARDITLAMESQTTSRIDLPAFLPLSNIVHAPSVLGDNKLIRGQGGGHSVQDSGITVSDTDLLSGLLDPVSDQDAATKKYVDDNAGGTPMPMSLSVEDVPSNADDFLIFFTDRAITITKIRAVTKGTSSTVTLMCKWRVNTAPYTGGTNIQTSNLVADPNEADTTSFADATIPANSHIVYTSSAVASSPEKVTIIVEFTED